MELPFEVQPHDAFRHGLASLKEDTKAKHPVEVIQSEMPKKAAATKAQMLRDLYGIAAPARAQIESSILNRCGRLPGTSFCRLTPPLHCHAITQCSST